MRGLMAGLAATLILASGFSATAQTYAPTTARLRELVDNDADMLPPPYAAKLRKQETDWEHRIGVTCTPTGYCYPDARAMVQTIQSHIFKIDKYIFDDEEWSKTFPLPPETVNELAGEAGSTAPITLDQNVPVIVAPLDATAIAFNLRMESYVDFLWEQAGGPSETTPTDDNNTDFLLDYSPNLDALPGVLSIDMSLSDYPHGAAHGEWRPANFNWNIAAERQVTPEDIFVASADWQKAVAQLAIAAFTRAGYIDSDYLTDLMSIVDNSLVDPQSWALLKDGLRIETSAYEICPYSCGAPSIVIPWSALRAYLKPGGLVHHS
jgi:hypothetical protein